MSLLNSLLSPLNQGDGDDHYLGQWNASTNTPTLPNPPTSADYEVGDYYQVSTAGTQFGITFTVRDEIYVVPDGAALAWAKRDAAAVDSVFGRIGNVTAQTGDYTVGQVTGAEATANKDASGGYVGLTLFKINFKNAANTFTSFFTNSNTAARTYTFQDRNGTIADDTDLATKQNTLTAANFGAFIDGLSAKTTPVDADEMNLVDSAASNVEKKVTWANVKATLKTYFDGLYAGLATTNTFTKAQRGSSTVLTDAATIAIDLDLNNDFLVVLGGNRTLGFPSNLPTTTARQTGTIDVYQDSTGSRTLAYNWAWAFPNGGTAPTLTTGKGAHDQLYYRTDYYVAGATATVTIATPAVVTLTANGFRFGQRVAFTATTGALPTGLALNTTYYVTPIDADTFKLSSSLANLDAGTFIATSGSQSGVHTLTSASITIGNQLNIG